MFTLLFRAFIFLKHGLQLKFPIFLAVIRDDFRQMPKNTDVGVGDTAVMECRGPKGSPEPRISWKKGPTVVHESSRIQVHENGNLIIKDARKDDSGMYTCIAENIAGEKKGNPARLSVKGTLSLLPFYIRPPEGSCHRLAQILNSDPIHCTIKFS